MNKAKQSLRLVRRTAWLLAAKTCMLLLGLVFAASITVTSTTYQAEFGSTINVVTGLIATDRGFSVSPTAGSSAGTPCPSNPVAFSATPGTANTTITAGHWVFDVRVNSTSGAPGSTTFNVTLVLASVAYGPLCVRTPASASNNQIIDCRFDVGASLPTAPYAFKVTIQ